MANVLHEFVVVGDLFRVCCQFRCVVRLIKMRGEVHIVLPRVLNLLFLGDGARSASALVNVGGSKCIVLGHY